MQRLYPCCYPPGSVAALKAIDNNWGVEVYNLGPATDTALDMVKAFEEVNGGNSIRY